MTSNHLDAKKIKITGTDGRRVSLASLPLVTFKLYCGHVGKDYAIQRHDVVFCEQCGKNGRVKTIIGS